ncbi:hypothetical protein CSW60_18895 [Caulobacter sp. X]|nr:hypothetical protein CSW60_18895 [Caulobacter sp. X]
MRLELALSLPKMCDLNQSQAPLNEDEILLQVDPSAEVKLFQTWEVNETFVLIVVPEETSVIPTSMVLFELDVVEVT